jgi:phospholipase/carboxylesterase
MHAAGASMLVILLHGVNSTPEDMAPLADGIAAGLPGVRIEAPAAPGRQWFSIDGITEENRAARTHARLPALVDTIRTLQRRHGVAPQDTVLAGFSQGATMALAACAHVQTQEQTHERERGWLARHVVAIAGRCMPLPERWDARTVVSLVHGRMDGVVPAECSRQAAAHLAALGADVRLDLVPRTVHLLTPALVERAVAALRDTMPGALPRT